MAYYDGRAVHGRGHRHPGGRIRWTAPTSGRSHMGFFSKILDKLGFDAGNSKVEEMLRAPVAPAPSSAGIPAAPLDAPVAPMREVDVVAQLEQKAAANPQ